MKIFTLSENNDADKMILQKSLDLCKAMTDVSGNYILKAIMDNFKTVNADFIKCPLKKVTLIWSKFTNL